MNICYLLISAILVQPVSKKKGLGEALSHTSYFSELFKCFLRFISMALEKKPSFPSSGSCIEMVVHLL